ncbi:MAG: hypothetical protein EOM67_03205 [Spirochaetia bacterium]|nr:hypothetical protein [Spirochaetia bacterium]
MNKTLLDDGQFILSSTNNMFKEKDINVLLNQIEVHKYLINQDIPWTISQDDAIFSWLENVYHPIMQVINQWSVRSSFAKYSDSQLFFAISDHWYYLLAKNEKISAYSAAVNYAAQYGTGLGHIVSKLSNPLKVA